MSNLNWAVAQALGGRPIDGELYKLRAEREAWLRGEQVELQSRCAEAQALWAECEQVRAHAPEVAAEVEGLLAQAQTVLFDQQGALQCAKQILEAYRLRQGLTRSPTAPNTAVSALTLGSLIMVEGGINAAFFQNAAMAVSPIASLLTSVLISISNVTVSACGGYFIGRYRDYGRDAADANAPEFCTVRRRSRWLFGGFLGVMAFFHTTVGLVRSSESLDHVTHSLASYAALLTTPEAVFLILTGSCLSMLAYHKGKNAFDDPYPGYGQRQRAVQALQDEILDHYDDFAQAIEDQFDEAQEGAVQHAQEQQQLCTQYNQAVSACYAARRNLERAVGTAESELRREVAQLANAHRSTRGRKSLATEHALASLVRFEGFLDDELPAYRQVNPNTQYQVPLTQAKADALERLGTLFRQALDTPPGDPS